MFREVSDGPFVKGIPMSLLRFIQLEFNGETWIHLVPKRRRAKRTEDRLLAIPQVEDHRLAIGFHSCRFSTFAVNQNFPKFAPDESVR